MDTAQIVKRLDIPGVALLAVGALLGFAGHTIAARFMPKISEKGMLMVRVAGMVLAIAGALILLDVFA